MMMLTNHHLILNEFNDTTETKGFNRLLYVNDTLFYTMPEHGIQQYLINNGQAVLTKEDFTDIRFNPNASFVLDGKVYLGSDIGVLKIDPFNANATKWIIFNSNVSDIRMALITGSFCPDTDYYNISGIQTQKGGPPQDDTHADRRPAQTPGRSECNHRT